MPETITLSIAHKKNNRQNKKWGEFTESWSGWSSFSPM